LSDRDGCCDEEAQPRSSAALLAMSATAATIAATAVLALTTTAGYGERYGGHGGQADVGTECADREGRLAAASVAQPELCGAAAEAAAELSDLEDGVLVHVARGGRGRHLGLGHGEGEGEGKGEEKGEEEGAGHGCAATAAGRER